MVDGLPGGVQPYKRTPSFDENSIPPGLLSDHSTKDGTWGLIRVEHGELRYIICDARRDKQEAILSPATDPGVVEPTIIHRVEPLGAVRFHVEFYR